MLLCGDPSKVAYGKIFMQEDTKSYMNFLLTE